MKRAWNIIWKIALCCVALGITLTLVGLSRGWPQPVGWGAGGFRVLATRDIHIDEASLPQFSTIDVNVEWLDVSVVPGDHFGLVIDARHSYRTITWSDDGGVLKVDETGPTWAITWFGGEGTVTITVPTATKLTRIAAITSVGSVRVASPADTISLTSSTGDVTLTANGGSVTAHSSTGDVHVSADATTVDASTSTGDVSVDGRCGTIQASSSTGHVSVEGTATQVTAKSSTGDVVITQSAPWSATAYGLRTSTGQIRPSGPGAPSGGGKQMSGQLAAPALTLTADTATGDIIVTLGV